MIERVFTPPKPEPVDLAGPAGRLEAQWEIPVAERYERVALVCHPHPLYGGTMTNKVVHMSARALHELGIPTLKFNFRGVGRSDGTFDEGFGETQDGLCALREIEARFPQAALVLMGFSFGSFIAYKLAKMHPAERLILIAPPVQRFDFARESPPTIPWSIIQGDHDDLVDHHAVLSWSNTLTPPPHVELLLGAEHFFHGRMTELKDCVKKAALLNHS